MAIYKVSFADVHARKGITTKTIKADIAEVTNYAKFYKRRLFRRNELVAAFTKWQEVEKTTEEDEF